MQAHLVAVYMFSVMEPSRPGTRLAILPTCTSLLSTQSRSAVTHLHHGPARTASADSHPLHCHHRACSQPVLQIINFHYISQDARPSIKHKNPHFRLLSPIEVPTILTSNMSLQLTELTTPALFTRISTGPPKNPSAASQVAAHCSLRNDIYINIDWISGSIKIVLFPGQC